MPKVRSIDTGVYRIRNTLNGKLYIGGAYQSFEKRFNSHRRGLRNGSHPNEHLLSAWRKYGEEAFVFEIIERCSAHGLEGRETFWIKSSNAVNREYGYNKSPTGGSPLGVKHSDKSRANFSKGMKKRMQDPEERRKVGNAMRGKKFSAESIARIKAARIKQWKNPEFRAKVIAANTGKKRTDAVRKMLADRMRGTKRSPETLEKMRLVRLGTKASEETKAKMSASIKLSWSKRREKKHANRIEAKRKNPSLFETITDMEGSRS